MSMPQPGDFMVCTSYGGSLLARIGSALIRWGTDAPVSHAAVYIGDSKIIQAEPGGASLARWDSAANETWSTGRLPFPITDAQRAGICTAAMSFQGTPYGVLDIIAITMAQHRLGRLVHPERPLDAQPWWVRRLIDPGTVICSQLVVLAYRAAGLPLCGTELAALVSPGDLWRAIGGNRVRAVQGNVQAEQ